MSIDEQIAFLESEKQLSISHFDLKINDLQKKKNEATQVEDDDLILPGGRRLIRSSGRTLSQVIIEDRGSY